MTQSPGDITRLVNQALGGDESCRDELFAQIHGDLHKMAAAKMAGERADHTWQATALVNELYLRMFREPGEFANRRHFFSAAANTMRRLLVEHARGRNAQKRGGDFHKTALEDCYQTFTSSGIDVVDFDRALAELERLAPDQAEVIKLRYIAGLSRKRIVEITGHTMHRVRNLEANGLAKLRQVLDET